MPFYKCDMAFIRDWLIHGGFGFVDIYKRPKANKIIRRRLLIEPNVKLSHPERAMRNEE